MTNLNSKLETTLKQWQRIFNKELAVSADLRNQERADQAAKMIVNIKNRMNK